MNSAKKKVERPVLQPGEKVPESGIYQVLHRNCESQAFEAILLAGHTVPECRLCGSSARYQLIRPIPHISEDPDFNG
jgi:hypothetical protein